MGNVYVRGDKERRMSYLGIIDQEKKVEFIDEALHEKLTIREKEREERILQKGEVVSNE